MPFPEMIVDLIRLADIDAQGLCPGAHGRVRKYISLEPIAEPSSKARRAIIK